MSVVIVVVGHQKSLSTANRKINKMSDELKKFIDEQFEDLRQETAKAFELARLRLRIADSATKSNKQQKAV